MKPDENGMPLIGYLFAALTIAVMCFLFALVILACKR